VPKRNLKITKVQVKNNHRIIELENGNVFRISEDVFLFNPIAEGDEISESELNNIGS
jgi:hypothetical protein